MVTFAKLNSHLIDSVCHTCDREEKCQGAFVMLMYGQESILKRAVYSAAV